MEMESILRMGKDIRKAASEISDDEARYLVDMYYQMQNNRIRSSNQERSLKERSEPNLVISWLTDQNTTLENQIKGALDRYVKEHRLGAWLYSVKGIGPVLAAGLLAHIDITKTETAGGIWRYAGLDPTSEWKKGEKRPWNATLKTLCWKIGQSFMKLHNDEECFYGKIYEEKKAYYQKKSDAGDYKEIALERMAKVGKSTEAYKHYKEFRLPPGQIDARARRFAVKLFLAHLFDVMYKAEYGKEPPLPYPIAILGHAHHIKAPE